LPPLYFLETNIISLYNCNIEIVYMQGAKS